MIDKLEQRRLLSVSAATLVGPSLTEGATFEVDLGIGTTAGTGTSDVVGPAMFGGTTATEIEAGTAFGDNKVFETLNSNGLLELGGFLGPLQETQTLSPSEVILPPTLTAGTVVSDSWTSTNGTTGTTVSQSETFDLVSETPQNVTVPAGTFSAYKIDYTLTTNNSGTISTQYEIQYWSPAVGQIELAGAASNSFVSVNVSSELASYNIPSSGGVSTASKLAFAQQPSPAVAGAVIAPSVTVDVENSSGQIATTDNSSVTLAIGSGPTGGTLSGTLTEPAVNGVATFRKLSLNKAGAYTLTATDGSLTAATSAQFTVTASTGPVVGGPVVTTNPASQTIASGNPVTFTAAATGTPTPTVQWQISTDLGIEYTNISGATSDTYSFTATAQFTRDVFRAVFTNSGGSAYSSGATLMVASASSGLQTFSGLDAGAGPTDVRPISDAAAESFDAAAAAIGNVSVITFEGDPTGAFNDLTVAPGVSISGTNRNGKSQVLFDGNADPTAPPLASYNTTSGGDESVTVNGGTVTFTFATPIQFFGAYFPGAQTFFNDNISFSDGTTETVSIPGGSSTQGGVSFAGFTDPGASITSITITGSDSTSWDAFGVDDVRYQSGSGSVVPLHLHVSETIAALATGKISPTAGDSTLTATATVTNAQNLWLSVSTTASGSAAASPTGSPSSTFAADGLIAPDGKASYSTAFCAVGDRVAVGLSMSAAAGVMNLLGMVLPPSGWTPSAKLIDELDKIYKTTALFNAKADLVAAAAGRISAASAANGIANYTAQLFANGDAQWKLVQADLKSAGVALTASEISTLETVSKIDKFAKTLIATAALDTQLVTGAPIDVDFFAGAG